MYKCKFTIVLALGFAILLAGFTGCAGKKKPPEAEKQVTKAPEKKPVPTPTPRVQEPPKKVEERVSPPVEIKFNTIYFDFDKSNIRYDQRGQLNSNAELMSQNNTVRILIEGHCDERGTNEYNMALGDRRANSAKLYFVEYGIDSSRISTVSYGEERPVDTRHNETAWAKNRRCEFTIIAR